MKHLLGLLVVALVIGYGITREDESGVSYFEKMTSGEAGPKKNIQDAQNAADIYQDATQKRIDAEFGS